MSKTQGITTKITEENLKTYLEHIRPTLDYYIQLYNADKASRDKFGNIWSLSKYKAKFSETEFRFMTGKIHLLYHTATESDRSPLKTLSGIKDTITRLVRIIYEAPRLSKNLTVYCGQKERLYKIGDTDKYTSHCILRTSFVPQIQHDFVDDKSGCCLYQIDIPPNSPLLIIPRNLGGPGNFQSDLESYIDKMDRGNVSIEDFVPFINADEFQILLPPHITLRMVSNTEQTIKKQKYSTEIPIINQKNITNSQKSTNPSYTLSKRLQKGLTRQMSNTRENIIIFHCDYSSAPTFDNFSSLLNTYIEYLKYLIQTLKTPKLEEKYVKAIQDYNYYIAPKRESEPSGNLLVNNDWADPQGEIEPSGNLLVIDENYSKSEDPYYYSMIHFIQSLLQKSDPVCNNIKKAMPKYDLYTES